MIGGFVQQEDVRALNQCLDNRQAFLPASGQRRCIGLDIFKTGATQQLGEAASPLVCGYMRMFQRVLDHGPHGRALLKLRFLLDVAEARALPFRYSPPVGAQVPGENRQRGGLPEPFGPMSPMRSRSETVK